MAPNRIFLSGAAVDEWLARGAVEIVGGTLLVRRTEDQFDLAEGVRIESEVSDTGDRRGLVGRVRPLVELRALGADMTGRTMRLGDAVYEVDSGFLASPVGARAAARSAADIGEIFRRLDAPPGQEMSDEEMLAQYLLRNLG